MKTTTTTAVSVRTSRKNRKARKSGLHRGILAASAAALIGLCLTPQGAQAATDTWYGEDSTYVGVFAGTSINWSLGGNGTTLFGNWTNTNGFNTPAPSSGDSLIFNTSTPPFTGGGALAYTANNNDFVGYTFNSITFNSAGNGSYNLSGNSITLGSGGLTNSSSVLQTVSLGITLGGAQTWNSGSGGLSVSSVNANGYGLTFAGTSNISLGNPITGGTTLAMNNSQTLVLNGNNTFSSASISAGSIGSIGGGSTLTLNGGNTVLSSTSTDAVNSNITLSNNAGTISSSTGTLFLVGTVNANSLALDFAGSGNTTLSNAIINGTTLQKDGAGTMTLTGTNLFTSATINGGTITGGTLSLSGGSSALTSTGVDAVNSYVLFTNLGGSTITSTANTLTLGGTVDANGQSLTITGSGNTTVSVNPIANGTFLVKGGSGTLALTGSNTFSSTTINLGTITGGTLTLTGGGTALISNATDTVSSNVTMSTLPGTVTSNSGTLTLSGTVSAGSMGITFAGNGNTSLSNAITNGTALAMTGSGTLTLGGVSNTFASASIANLGTIAGSTLILNGGGTVLSSTGTDTVSSNVQLSTNAGTIRSSAGTLSLTGTVDANFWGLSFTGPGSTTLSNAITNGTTLVMSGTGTLTLAGTNTFNSASISGIGGTITGGTLSLPAGGNVLTGSNASGTATISSAVSFTNAGGSIIVSTNPGALLSLTGTVNANSNSLTFAGSGNTTLTNGITSGAASPNPAVTMNGTGTVTFNGANSYTGTTTVNSGTLLAGAGNTSAFGSNSAVTVTGGALDLGGNNNTVGSLAGTGGVVQSTGGTATLTTGGLNTNTTFSGILQNGTGTLSLVKNGTGTFTLGGVNTYAGSTTVNNGVLAIATSAGSTALGSPVTGTTVNSGATLLLQANATTGLEPITLIGQGYNNQGALVVQGPGISTIGGLVTLGNPGGATTVVSNAGTTIIFSGGLVKDNQTLVFQGPGAFIVNTNPISGPTSFKSDMVINGGTTTFNTANSYAGPTWIGNGGTLNATVVGALPSTAADGGIASIRTLIVMDPDTLANFPGAPAALVPPGSTAPSTLNLGANQAIQSLASPNTVGIGQASFVSLGNSRLTIGTGAGSTTFFGVIGGGALGNIVKDGASTQILAGNNTYTGPTVVQAGHLQIGVGGATGTPGNLNGSSAVSVSGGAFLDLNLANNGIFANNVTNNGTVQGINAAGNTQTASGVITGTGNFLQNAGGKTILTNINTYQGGTTISGLSSALQVGSGAQQGSLGTGAVSVSGSGLLTLVNVDGNVFPNNVSNTVGGTAIVDSQPANATTTTLSGTLTDSGGAIGLILRQVGAGTTVLTNGGNTYSGGTIVLGGVLQVGTAGSPSLPGSNVAANNISLNSTLSLVNVSGGTLNNNIGQTFLGLGTVNANSATPLTLAGNIVSGASGIALTQTGAGTTTLTSGANTIDNGTTVSAGGLTIGTAGSASRLDAAGTSTVNVGTGGVLTLTNLVGNALANNIGNTLGGAGSVIVNSANSNTLSGILSNASGTLSLTQSGTAAGVTTTLTGANTYTGNTLVTAGHLQIGNGTIGSISGTSAVTVNSGAFLDIDLANGGIFSNNVLNNGTVQGINTFAPGNPNVQTVSGIISGSGVFNQNAGGTTIFTANNTFGGGTNISGGASTVQVGTAALPGSLGSGTVSLSGGGTLSLINVNGGTFANNVSNTTLGPSTVRSTPALGATTTISGAITDAGTPIAILLNHNGAGTTVLTNSGNTYSNGTVVSVGTLQIGTAGSPSLPGLNASANGIGIFNGGILSLVNVSGGTLNNNVFAASGGVGTVNANSATALTLAGALTSGTNTLALTQTGAGTTTLTSGGNTLSSVTVSAGGLTVGGGTASRIDAAGTATVNVGGTGTLALTNLTSATFANNIGNTLGGAGSVVVNTGTSNTLSGVLSNAAGTLSLTQSGVGTTTLTGANTYTGATNVTGGTLQVGNGTSGNIVSSPINISGGATLVVNLANTATLGGNIVNGGTVVGLNATPNSQTLSGNISGGGAFAQTGTGTTFLTGANTYTGATSVAAGILRVNGSLGATTVTVSAGATLGGNGIIGGPVTVLGGGNLSPGNSPGTLTVSSLTLTNAGGGSNSNFELNIPGVIGQAALPGNDLVNVTGQLTLAGNINVIANPTISAGSYRLFNYGTLINSGTTLLPSPVGAGLTGQLVFGVTGQVNLLVLNSAAIGITQFWDGPHANGTTIEGGNGTWDNFNNNWTNAAGTTNASWQNGVANFGGASGTVTLGDNINAQGLVFGTTGYVIQGAGAFTLNLVGPTPAPTITVTGGLTATITAQITGSAGLTSNGGGTLVLGNAANAYTGGTTITGGGAVSIGADGALGATGAGNGITLNTGSLMATATFGSARTVALAGAGTVDVTNTNVLTLSGIISGAAGNALTKVDTGTLNLTGANTYSGGTVIVAGTVQIASDGNLGSTGAGTGVTFGGLAGGNATLQTLGPITSARGITLNTGGGTFDTNGFNSTLSGVIGGAAGNPFTKVSLGTLTVTGASTYLGQTNVNGGTLQVGDGGTPGTTIGNGTANVVVGASGTLAINLPAGGTFGNPVANGGIVNAISTANSQTISGIISGAGVFNQNAAGTTILTAVNTFTGATNVLQGHLQIGNGGNLASGSQVNVSGGAFLDLNLANNATFAPASIADSGTVQGINTVGNTQTVSGVISGGGTFNQTGAGTTIFTGVNTYGGGTTINNAGIVQVGTAGVAGALGTGAVTIGNAGGTLNLVNISTNTFANSVSGTGGTDTVNVNSANTNTLSGAYTGSLSLNQIGAGTTILANAGNTYTNGTKVSLGNLQVGTVALPGSIGNNLAANAIVVGTGGTLTFVNLAAATNPLLNNITNSLGGVGLVNMNSANAITLGGTLTNTSGTLALTQSGTGTTILTNAGNAYTGATTVTAGTLQIGTGVSAGSIGATAVVVQTGGILSLINVATGTFANAVSNGALGTGFVNVGGSQNPLTISGVLSDGALGQLALTQSGTGKTILTNANTYTGATTVSNGTLQVGNGTTGSIATGSAVTVTSPGVLDVNLANNTAFANTVLNNGTVRGINANGTTETFSGVISGSGSFSQISGTGIFTNVNSYAGTTNLTGASTILQIGTAGLAATPGVGTINVAGGSTLQIVNVNTNTLSNNITNNTAATTGTVLSTSAQLNTILSGTLTDGAGQLALTQNGSGTTTLANTGNTYTGLTTVQQGTLQIGTNAIAGSLGNGNTIKVGTGGTLSIVNIGNPGTLTNASITNTLGGVGTVNFASNNNNTIQSQLTDGGPGTIQVTQTGLGTTTLTAANTYSGTTTITAGVLQIGAGGAAGSLGTGAVTDNASLVFNLTSSPTVANAISGTGSLTQLGSGTTILTGANSYGTTLISAGTLQIGAGGIIGTLGTGGVTDNAALVFNRSNTMTVANAIGGSGTVAQSGTGTTVLTGVSTYTGATSVTQGNLQVNGQIGLTATSVSSGATLSGAGSILGAVTVANGGILAPGTTAAPGTLTVGSLVLNATSALNFRLGTPGQVGQLPPPGNDLVNVTGNLTFAGNINVTQQAGFGAGSYRLFNYGGALTNNGAGTITVSPLANNLSEQVITGIPGQVNLLVLNTTLIGLTQYWDGPHADNTSIEGGNGTWDGFQTNWTTAAGTTNAAWQNGVAVFSATAGTVTLASPVYAQGLAFTTTGYTINGTGINTLNLVGPLPGAPTINVSNGLTATINAQILGTVGLTSNGQGTLVLGNAANGYSGGTTVTGGGAVSISADGNLGAGGVGNGVTLNNGTLQTTATFASPRAITLTGTGTFDVTNANVFTANGVISGTGALSKIDIGTLVLANAANSYNGPTNIVNGTVQVAANGYLGAAAGGITFGGAAGNTAILQTTAGINFGTRAVTLNTAGGTIDTQTFNSTLGGVITGAAGNPLTKIGSGTLTLTGTSTYLGQTNVNGGTLQVGDGSTPGTMIGNGTAAVVLNNNATLALNLPNLGTFGNPVTANAGSTVFGINVVGTTQTASGIISGAGGVTQSGAGTTILTATNTYGGPTLVTAGFLQIGDGTTANASIANSISTTVNSGATLAIKLANNETFTNSVADNGTVDLLSANTQTIQGVIGGSGVLNQRGAGTAILTGNNNYAGITTIFSPGTLQIGNGGVSGSLGIGNVTDNGNLVFNRSDSIVVGNLISGSGTLKQQGAGVTTLIAANTYTGATTVANGTLQIGNGSTVGAGIAASSPVTVNLGATLAINLANNETFGNNVADSGTVNGISANMQTLSGNITTTGAGVLTQSGTGTLILTGTNSYTTTTITAGRLQIGNGGGTGTLGAGAVTDNGALIFNRNNLMTVGNLISGTGTVSQQGTGTTVLAAANTYSGATTVTQGTLQIGDGFNAGASIVNSNSVTVNGSAMLAINLLNGETFLNNVTDNGVVAGINTTPGVQTLAGNIVGSGAVSQTGNGTTILTGTNTYLGATNISLGGTIQVGAGGTIGTLGTGNVADSGALVFNRSNLMTVANTITGTGTVTQNGTGTTILTATNTYTGATTVATGTLQIGDGSTPNASIASTVSTTVNANATLVIKLAPNETFLNNVANSGAVTGSSANAQTLSGVISGGGVLNQNGAGTMILTGNNTYTGTTTITAGTLQVGAGGTSGAIATASNIVDNSALVFNRSDAIIVGNQITGTGTLTQAGTAASKTTLTNNNNTYSGVTNVTTGTLQIGDGNNGNITSPQINVSGGATLAVNLPNNQTLVGNIANTGTINSINAIGSTQTLSGNITGTGVFNQTGAGLTILTGASNYTGATTVSNGNLRVNGSLGNTAVTVQSGATLSGAGSIAGNVTILSGGNLSPGTNPGALSAGTLTTGNLVLNAGANLNFDLGVAGVIGQQALPGNDLVNVNGNLTLAGNLNVTPNPTMTSGSYRLFNYTGTLTNNGIANINGVPSGGSGFTPVIVTATQGQVNLLVLANNAGPVQFWDGTGTIGNGVVDAGSGNWNNFTSNWTNVGGNPNASWQNGTAVFIAPGGTVTITDTANAQGLIFGTTGYAIDSTNGSSLNLVGQNPAVNNVPYISVTNAGDVATINAVVSNFYSPGTVPFGLNGGLTSTGAGTLVLTNTGNSYTGGTTITGGGTVSISADHNLGAVPGAPGTNDLTLNNGVLQATSTFTLNSNRSIILAGAGGIDVTGANRLTYGGVISGTGSLAKTNTGILTLSGVNTYTGGTLILGGTLEISNDNNLGAAAGSLTFGNGATLKTLAGITSARGISLNGGAGGGGVIDTNGFNSTLTGVITGSAGNGLVKNGGGVLTVTGTSTYLGVTTINAGTLQVGDNGTVGAQIGNNTANVIVGNNATLDVRLTNGGTFNNTISTAIGGTINSTNNAGSTQTFGGVISGAGTFNQNGLGTAVLNGANTYTGLTSVNAGTVVLGTATALGSVAGGTIVVSGATLDLNGQIVGGESLAIAGAGVGGGGALINGGAALNGVIAAASLAGNVTLTGDTTITTYSANANATNAGSITLGGNIGGGFGIIKNGSGTLTLTGLNIYSGQTLINAGILQAGNQYALGSVGGNTVVASGASLQILANVAVVGEPVTINGFGAGAAAPGALTQSLNGSSSLAGPITVATNANISTNGTGTLTLTGGITKNGTTLTLNGGGTININGVGISGATSFTSDLVVDGTGVGGATVVNLNVASSYAGPTWITNGGTLNANVVGALPAPAADGGIGTIRTTIIMDPVAQITGSNAPFGSTGGSILNLGANQAIQSLTSTDATSKVNLVTNTLTIGTSLGGTTTFAGVISGANPTGASIIKDGTSTQILSGPNTYTGSTLVKGGTLRAGIATLTPGPTGTVPTSGAFGVDSVMIVNAGGTLELAGFSNTVGTLSSTPLPGGGVVQNTAVGNNAPATLTIDGINAAGTATAVNFGGTIVDTATTALSIIKNGAGTQIFSGANTYIGTTTVNGGILQAGVATVTPAGPAGTVPTSGAFGVDSVTTVNVNSVLELAGFSNTIGSLSGGGANSFVQNTLNGAATLTIDGVNAAGAANAVTYTGVIKDTATTVLSIAKNGAGTQIFAGQNSYIGATTVNAGVLQSGISTNAGNTWGAFGVNSATTVGTSATPATLALNGFSDTIGTLSGNTSGIIQNGSAVTPSVLTFGSGVVAGTTVFSGVVQNGGAATLSLVKIGTGIQTLAGTAANTYTGLTTVNAGELDLNKTAGVNAIGGNLTIGDGLGGANSDIVKLLAANQIIPTSLVLINGTSGRLDLNNNSQTVGSIADTGIVTLGGSTINLGSGTLTTGAGGGANPANPSTTFSGVITGVAAGALTKTGTGTFTLKGINTYTSATNVNAGTLQAGSTQAFGINSPVTVSAAGTLDLAGNSNSIGSLAGAAGGIVKSTVGPATLTTGGLNTSTVFAGALQDGVGPLSLVKNGTGTQTLGGTNIYTGTTTVNAGTLLAGSVSAFGNNSAVTVNAGGTLDLGGNSNTIGSLSGVAGGTVQSTVGAATLTTGGLNTNVTFSGTIQDGVGPLAFVKNGTGVQILSGTNSYTGGTTLNAGTLAAGSMKAFGSGNLTLLGGTLRTSGGPLIVDIGSGNVLFGGGLYVANVGGVIPGVQHDQLTTTGAANIGGGTLALVQQNAFQLAPGAKVNLLVATGGVAGGSALGTPLPAASVLGLSAFSSTPLLVPTVNLYPTTVTLEAMQGSFANLGGVFGPNGQFIGFTPNQIATARALDSVSKTINFKTGILSELNYLDTQPLGTLPSNLDKIAPEEFAAFFQNAVALANVQTANLGRRMDDIRNQAPISSASGLAAAGSGPSYSGGLSGPSGKRSKEIVPANDERWGAFLTGSGEFTHVGSTTNAAGYRFETAGVTGGLDYRVNDHFAIGMNFGYVGTTSSLVNGGKIDTDGGRLGLYATYFDKNFHVDAAVTGGLNSYNTRRTTPNNTSAIASPDGSEINVLIAAGYDWKVGKFTVGPTASYQYTNVHTNGFTETGPFAPLAVNGQSTESSRTSLGVRAYYDAQVAGIVIRPELRLAWQHEFGDSEPAITSRFATLGGNPFTVHGPQIGRDSLLMGAGFTVMWSERFATYLYYDGEVGRSNYDSHNISGGIRLQW